ncbi:metal-sensing transcriptional repressor [Xiamenia xianingshaonis]|uniref:Metal-sensing transcriptional repressor n=1 Tax=Xiamenia xianingshaonis TaxID=2682776 RepID=A0A9E6MP06_9ACTN|nr:metal-sensing transcriptional repressor [Xiamenia xianingshaonis]NHM13795.1 metal-sensing transcriptional repressor [Xiamenia xianingshaonis]QTU83657.1 metal-sensing transcriptional repressor [Xiamenia xianingshaonis]
MTDPTPAAQACCGKQKDTPRSDELQADLTRRINRAIGQLGGVKAMIEDNRYCGDVLTQLAAVESAVHAISGIVLTNHFHTCVVEQIQAGNEEIVDEALALVKKFSR